VTRQRLEPSDTPAVLKAITAVSVADIYDPDFEVPAIKIRAGDRLDRSAAPRRRDSANAEITCTSPLGGQHRGRWIADRYAVFQPAAGIADRGAKILLAVNP
jgi:hypothetical protein